MDFNLPADDDPRRLELRRWFEANPSPTPRQIMERGLAAPNWPPPWGISADTEMMMIVDDEFARARVRRPSRMNPIALNQCGQSLLKWGTEAQREELIPPAMLGEQRWCMLFSEPSGGSDVGSLRTTARRDGDHYIVNGQKTWNSGADTADIGVLIARTDSTVPKHRGLTTFIIDMKSPGVTVRPIVDMTGEKHEYNEVFLEDVRVPATRRIGEEGDGWRITMEQLQSERQGMTQPGAVWGAGPTARELVYGLAKTGKLKDPLVRDEAAKLYIEGELLRLLSIRGLSNKLNGKPSGPEGSLGKMIASPHGQRLSDLAKRSEGAPGMIWRSEGLPLPRSEYGLFSTWDYVYWFSPAGTIGVGTQEVLKNAVAERILGLPRDSDPSIGLPFNQIGAAKTAAA
jgi:alkylation response protein AidB-like acyl-CoA dehydrogenase